MRAAAWFTVHTAVSANENYILQVAKSPVQTHCAITLATVTPSIPPSVICRTTPWPLHDEPYYWQASHQEPERGSTPPTRRPCLFISAYQHPPRILSCLLITLWKSRLIQMSRPITCEQSRGDLSPYLAVINTTWRMIHIWITGKWIVERWPNVQ